MSISSLIVTGHSDLPETHLIIGLYQHGIELEVLCPSAAPRRQLLLDAGVPVFDLDLKGRFDRQGINVIRQHLNKRSVDIVHTFNNKTLSNSLFAVKGHHCKVIAYRGIEGNVSYYDPMSWLTYLHPRVTSIVCVADAIRRYFWEMRFLGFNWPVKKAITIYKGHHPDWYKNETTPLSEFNVPETGFFIGCTVNDRPRKGLKYLIEATYLLPKDLPIYFIFIGKVTDSELRSAIAQSPYAENIYLLGFQKNAATIIKQCDICILPAVKREGLPKAIIEGMIQGVAPIVTDSGGSPELIENEKSGLIVPPKSSAAIAAAIKQFYYDSQLLDSIKNAAQKRIEDNFHINNTIAEHLVLYKNLIDRPITD